MAKVISLVPEAYERLKAKKRRGESFSDVVLRVTKKTNLSNFAGILTEKEGKTIERKVRQMRGKSRKRATFFREAVR